MSELALRRIEANKKTKEPYLNLNYCDILKLPKELEDCIWLEELVLHNNIQLSDIEPVNKLVNLVRINFSETSVYELSPLNNLPKINKIDAEGTKVLNVRPLLPLIERGLTIGLGTQYDINLVRCPLKEPPIEIVRQGANAIQNYFSEREQQGTIKGSEAKMLIVGEGGSGKTSLVRRLFRPEKSLPEENESTKGIDIHHHNFKIADGSNFRLNVWDFGGQEIYHATHQFFLTKRSLYVLVDDTRKDHKTIHDEGFKYWLEVVDLLSAQSPLLIFQNEKSDRSKQIDISGIKGMFLNVQGVWAGNLEYPKSVDRLREAIEFHAKNLPHVGEDLPAKWVAIRSELEKKAIIEPYISKQEYFKVYSQYLELDRTKALHLSQYLHDLGVFLHFQDDALLARTIILQNSWATEAVFKMLDDETVKGNFGRFTEEDCHRVWADSTWVEMHPELLALMQKFELCYLLPDSQHKAWLVPQLLPFSKPVELTNWAKPGDLVLRYRYEFLPKGLVSRLMVRKNRFVTRPNMAWASGVLFERGKTQVLVEIPAKGGEIVLRARGVEHKELLSVIAADLDVLNESFHGLPEKVTKLVPCNCAKCHELAQPEFFDQKRLLQRKYDKQLNIECPTSYEKVNVLELLDGFKVEIPINWEQPETGKEINKSVNRIKELIESGQTEEALKLYKQINLNEALVLMSKLSELKKQYPTISGEVYLLEKAKINVGLLSLLDD